MSFSASGFDDVSTWGAPPESQSGDVIKDAIRKEQIIKDIVAARGDLRALLERVKSVQGDVDKFTSDNATLQMYIDNLTVQMARRRQ